MKPAARDQDIPRRAGSGAPEARETPGGAHRAGSQVSAFGAEFSSEACRELGFSSNLLCSSCDLLGQFNLLQLDPDCRGCCQEEAQFETKKLYAGAILEVCG